MTKKMQILFDFDEEEGKNASLCGIDEAGRGPLAGPLVMAGVILEEAIEGLGDSKAIGEKKRETLFEKILESGRHHIAIIEHSEIDELGISRCLRKGLEEIVSALEGEGVRFLFDGNSSFGVAGITTMIKADAKIPEVGAASILAKVTRDRIMVRYAEAYPGYGFERHKGYGTRAHIEAIERLGYCPIHRRSFRIRKRESTLTGK